MSAHRVWMSRMLAIGFAPVTMRILFGAGIVMFNLDAREIFSTCLIAGMIINMLVVEWWLRKQSTDRIEPFRSDLLVEY